MVTVNKCCEDNQWRTFLLKNRERRFSELKHKVMSSKQPRVLIRLNNKAEVAYLKSIGINTKPVIYKITPPYRPDYIPKKSDPRIAREVLTCRKATIISELKPGEVKILENYGAKVEEYKYWAYKPEKPPVTPRKKKRR